MGFLSLANVQTHGCGAYNGHPNSLSVCYGEQNGDCGSGHILYKCMDLAHGAPSI